MNERNVVVRHLGDGRVLLGLGYPAQVEPVIGAILLDRMRGQPDMQLVQEARASNALEPLDRANVRQYRVRAVLSMEQWLDLREQLIRELARTRPMRPSVRERLASWWGARRSGGAA